MNLNSLAPLFLLLLLSPTTLWARELQVWFIPLDVNFYTPTTPENVQERGVHFVIDSPDVEAMLEAAKTKSGKMRDSSRKKITRIKISDQQANKDYFITQDRWIFFAQKESKISKSVLSRALRALEKIGAPKWSAKAKSDSK